MQLRMAPEKDERIKPGSSTQRWKEKFPSVFNVTTHSEVQDAVGLIKKAAKSNDTGST